MQTVVRSDERLFRKTARQSVEDDEAAAIAGGAGAATAPAALLATG
jgi:hypothetical protein